MDAATARFSDRMGQIFENEGEQRTAGRMFGFLLVSEGVVSLNHLAEALGVSKASASTNARALAQMGILERVSRPGDRQDYYRVTPDGVRTRLPDKTTGVRMAAGDRFVVETSGGGGLGDPASRQPALIAADLADGRITAEGARAYESHP